MSVIVAGIDQELQTKIHVMEAKSVGETLRVATTAEFYFSATS